MTGNIETVAAGSSTLLGAFAGSKIGLAIQETIPMPEWAQLLLGPCGALIGVLVALRWMVQRLAKAERMAAERESNMRAENKADRKEAWDAISILQKDSNATTQAAVEVMRDVKSIIEKCSHGRRADS